MEGIEMNHYSIRAKKDNATVLLCATDYNLDDRLFFLNENKYSIESCKNITTGKLMEVEG